MNDVATLYRETLGHLSPLVLIALVLGTLVLAAGLVWVNTRLIAMMLIRFGCTAVVVSFLVAFALRNEHVADTTILAAVSALMLFADWVVGLRSRPGINLMGMSFSNFDLKLMNGRGNHSPFRRRTPDDRIAHLATNHDMDGYRFRGGDPGGISVWSSPGPSAQENIKPQS